MKESPKITLTKKIGLVRRLKENADKECKTLATFAHTTLTPKKKGQNLT